MYKNKNSESRVKGKSQFQQFENNDVGGWVWNIYFNLDSELIYLYSVYERSSLSDQRLEQSLENDNIDRKYGYYRYKENQEKVGWLLNIHPVSIYDKWMTKLDKI